MLETVLNHLKIGNELPRWTLSVYFSIKWCLNNFRLGPVVGLTQTLSDMLCISYLPSKLELVLVDFFRALFLVLLQVPGQTFTYRFYKLPYKYEPGITRSLRYQHKMAASLHEQEGTTPDQATTQIKPSPPSASEQTSFLCTGSPSENSWLLIPKPALPVRVCPRLTTQLPPQKRHVVNLSSMTLPTSVQPAPVIPVFETGFYDSSATSIPVSVIKRVQTANETCFNATLTNNLVSIAANPPPPVSLFNVKIRLVNTILVTIDRLARLD